VVKKDNLHYMAGVDYTLAGITMSAQFIQEYIMDYDREIRNDEFESTMTFLARKTISGKNCGWNSFHT
jgi:hypothetical protein